ncbi:hypothetical protein BT69DRAFT_1261304 [Atractiella rhizophila]|nr:hypothetical protein BT69DRAFT_1261304 [Atractiella rhizophila]
MPSNTLKLAVYPNVVFVHPTPSLDPSAPTNDPVIQGNVDLHLSQPRKVKEVVVVLKTFSSLSFPDKNTFTVPLLEKELKIEIGRELEKGDHSFVFSFIIPSSAAPYERCRYGRIWSKVTATAKCPGFNSNLSASDPIEIIANPDPEGEAPVTANVSIGDFTSDLGLFSLKLSSPHLTVAGLLHVDFSFDSLPHALRISIIECAILQSFELHDLQNEQTGPIQVKPVKRGLFQKRGEEGRKDGWTLKKGQSWGFKELARLPDDDFIRATTLPGTITPIRSFTSILFQVMYQLLDEDGALFGEVQTLSLTKKVVISSCCCLMESLTLPSYTSIKDTESTGIDRTGRPQRPNCSMECQCGTSFTSLLKSDLNKFFMDSINSDSQNGTNGEVILRAKWQNQWPEEAEGDGVENVDA